MKFLFASVVLASTLLIAIGSESNYCDDCPANGSTCSNVDNAVDRFSKTNFEYTADILRYLIRTFPKENVVGSPPASLYISGILGLYSCGRSQYEILRALKLKKKQEIRCVISEFNKVIGNAGDGIFFTIEGSNIFANAQYPLSKPFRRDMVELILGQGLNTDFSNPRKAANFINSVVANETSNKINNVISEDNNDFSEKTQLVSVTALYFDAEFKYRFDTNSATKGPFYGVSGTEEAEYRNERAVYDYACSNALKSQVLAVPYRDTYIGITILPYRNTNLNYVIKQIGNQKVMESVLRSLQKTDVTLIAPTFNNITTTFTTKNLVENSLGITSIFDPNCAQFEGITKNKNQCVSISGGIQKFVFQANGNGGPVPDIPEGLPTAKVNLNRPYVYLVVIKVKSNYFPVISTFRGVV